MSYGLDTATQLLEKAHGQSRLAHAYLISGPEGAGKERLAINLIRLVQPELSGQEDDLARMESGSVRILRPESKSRRIKIEQVRELEHVLQMTAARRNQWKVAIIVDAERMMPQAQNAFLKTLEEPPQDCLLLLLTTAPEELLETIRSRCLRVVLQGDGTAHLASPESKALLEKLESHFERGSRGVAAALSFARSLGESLKTVKKRMEKETEEALKEEAAGLKNRIEGDYLDRREEEAKAAAQAAYLAERARLTDVLVSWFGDAVRQQCGYGRLDLADFASTTSRMAASFAPEDLIKRLQAVENLRDLLGTNVQESLALEVSMLKALA